MDLKFSSFNEGLTRNVLVLGVVSGLTDISSEMLYPILPIFLTGVLHAPMSAVGLIEGVAEATASLLKAPAGWWSDRIGRRKPFAVWGYGLSAASKPLLALASTWHWVLLSRFLDRVGKGVRTSARDALICESSPRSHRGKAFGFHRALDTLGAAIGPLLAVWLLEGRGWPFQRVFVLAVIPAVLGVLILSVFVSERKEASGAPPRAPGPGIAASLPPGLRRFLAVYGVFCIGNSSDVFILLKAKAAGFTTASVVLAYVGYNLVYALAATPAGWLSDRVGRVRTLILGLAVFAGVYLGFGLAESLPALWVLFAAYGVHAALTENVAKALVADLSAPETLGTALGLFQAATGILAFAASAAAGLLWTRVSPQSPFFLAAACGAVSCGLLAAGFVPNMRK